VGAITLVVADDHQLWRSGVRNDLGEGFRIVGDAGTADEAIVLVQSMHPDVVLCDLNMPGGGLKVVRACADATRIIMLTVSEAERDVLDAVAAGAVGYLAKNLTGPELQSAVRAAAAGEPVFSPGLALLVMKEFRRISAPDGGPTALTPREREVLQHVARGHTYRQVGADLYISEKTVETHVRNILAKLHLHRREELARYAADHGIS
jgi:DNA-binding NarL/FixJ family response regulator